MKFEGRGIFGAGVWILALIGRCSALPNRALHNPALRNDQTTRSPSNQTDGLGLSYAESCQADIFAYYQATSSWNAQHAYTVTGYYTSNYTYDSYVPGTTSVHEVVTLCDGYPRVVGRTSASVGPTFAFTTTYTNTNPSVTAAPYTGPSPTCWIGPRDCELLQSSWTSHWNALPSSVQQNGGLLSPPCSTSFVSEPSYSTNAQGGQCNNCLIVGHDIRLLYWPVTTVPGVGDLCHTDERKTITAAPGPDGPRTYVTDGITITSPSVAISIGGLSRVDGCGATVNKTIIPVAPDQVTSVRGARALFQHYAFDFGDLNYKCLDSPDEIFISDEGRDDCYQQVPADAYWDGYAIWAGLGGRQSPNATIWNNYQPQVLPPATLSAAISSIWGNNCYIHPDGVWDPPQALQEASTIDLPTMPGGSVSHSYTTPAGQYVPTQPSPTQAVPTVHRATPTAAPDHTGDPHSTEVSAHSYSSEHGGQPTPTATWAACTINGQVYTYTTLPDGRHALVNPTVTAFLNNPQSTPHNDDNVYTIDGHTFTYTRDSDSAAPVLVNDHSTVTLTGNLASITALPSSGEASTRLAAYIASVFSMSQDDETSSGEGMKSVTLGSQTFAVHTDSAGGYELMDGTSTLTVGGDNNDARQTAVSTGAGGDGVTVSTGHSAAATSDEGATSRTASAQSAIGTSGGNVVSYVSHLALALAGSMFMVALAVF